MNRIATCLLTVVFALGAASPALVSAAEGKSAAELEKEKAMKEPYANDFGPESLDKKTLESYPKEAQEGYKLLIERCTVCHTASRPLNSQFVETDGKDVSSREKAVAELKKSHPDLFSKANDDVWQVEGAIWQRYVKRMMNKPGCEVSKADGKKIWEFLSHDSRARKLGKNKDEWAKHRRKLLEDFKKAHPKRYKELYEH